jgi:hypothetical protein
VEDLALRSSHRPFPISLALLALASSVSAGEVTHTTTLANIPIGGSTPNSVQGQVTQPGTRTYQVFYRDAQNYCTSATYNVTSGSAIRWGA